MKTSDSKWVYFVAFSFFGIILLLSPVVAEYLFKISNPNNTPYISDILTKHFVKVTLSLVIVAGLINTPFFLLSQKWRSIYICFLFIGIYLISILDFLHVMLFHGRANASSFYSVFSANRSEALEFVVDYLNLQLFSGVLLIIIIPWLFCYTYTSLPPIFKKIIFLVFLFLLGVAAWINRDPSNNYTSELSANKFYASYLDYRKELNEFNNAVSGNDFQASHSGKPGDEVHIIVIGESTSAFHMQLYGYDRATTPELEKMKSELLIYKNVKSTHVHTVASLKDALVLKDANHVFTNNTLVDLFRKSGYRTYWLSNQEFLGINQTLISSIANRADKKIFISPLSENKFDGDLIPELDKILNENVPRKIIFIHLMGTHLSYEDRYPPDFNIFKSKNISPFGDHADSFINSYDNAVLYNDHVVSELIKRIRTLHGINSLVYFSDHGDEVYDFRDFHGHSETLLSKYMNSIPFIIYLNKSYQMLRSEKYVAATGAVNSDFSLGNLPHTLQDLYDIHSSFFDPSKSFLAGSKERPAINDLTDTIQYHPPLFPAFREKIWVHRVNSLERLNLVQDKFNGIELDVVYENRKFDVRHPPAVTIGLSLEKYFSNVRDIKNHYFWLDLKNLEDGNVKDIIRSLNKLMNQFPIKKNIIIETPTADLIPVLKSEGYTTSYYLPYLANAGEKEINARLKKISGEILKNNPHAVSQALDNYQLMHQHYGNYNKLIWALNADWHHMADRERINLLLKNDTTIRVCVVSYETEGWR